MSKLVWHMPSKKDVLIFDKEGSENILIFLDNQYTEVFHTRGESVNLCILLKSFFKKDKSYTKTYIEAINPKVIITFIDNSSSFYGLSIMFPSIKTIFIQNAYRAEAGDIFGELPELNPYDKKFYVDYMFTFGDAVGREYSKYIGGEIIPIGSFKNNIFMHNVKPLSMDRSIVFISQYRNKNADTHFFKGLNGSNVYWDEYYASETSIVKMLDEYCCTNSLELKILGRSSEKQGSEYVFFSSLLNNCKWTFIPRKNSSSNYEEILTTHAVVYIDSTLGYEALARGQKCVSFSTRGKFLHSKASRFGWPAELQDKGPFWTDEISQAEFDRLLNYIVTVDDKEWDNVRSQNLKHVILFDHGNSKFVEVMNSLGVRLKKDLINAQQ